MLIPLRLGRDFRKVKTPGKVPVRAVPVSRKLSTIEELRQDNDVCSGEEITRRRLQPRKKCPGV
jgi:hypothetical protein